MMSKFRQGETSSTVIDKRNAITKSIIRKSKLIDKIKCYEDIPSSLEIKKHSISQASVHKWSDSQLDIIGYARNSAHSEHNTQVLNTLIESIKDANERLPLVPKPIKKDNGESATRLSQSEVEQLKNENEEFFM